MVARLATVMSSPPKAKSQLDHSSLGRSIQWKAARDDEHTPNWDLKMQREHEAKNPGPVTKNLKRERETIVISDDDDAPEEDQADGKLCALDLWVELIKDKLEHWDMQGALMHGKTAGYEGSSTRKEQRQREESSD